MIANFLSSKLSAGRFATSTFQPKHAKILRAKRSEWRQKDPNVANGIKLSIFGQKDPNVVLKPAQGATSETLHTNHTDPYFLISERENGGSEQRGQPWFELTEQGSRKITPEYENWLRKKGQQLPTPPVLIERWIESEAVLEANQRQFLQERSPSNGVVLPPLSAFDFFDVETQLAQMMLSGNRGAAYTRLKQLWSQGFHEEIEQICKLYKDWGFVVSDQGVSDGAH